MAGRGPRKQRRDLRGPHCVLGEAPRAWYLTPQFACDRGQACVTGVGGRRLQKTTGSRDDKLDVFPGGVGDSSHPEYRHVNIVVDPLCRTHDLQR